MRKLGLVLLTLCLAAGSALGLAACGDSSAKEGGTLTGSYAAFPDSLDPAVSYSQEGWTAMYNTYLPLLTYAHANGEEGGKVIPALAESLPEISNDGKTYTLQLRKGLKYSDGSPVKASDFTSSIERVLELNSPGSGFYTGIVGAEEFAETKEGGISGIKADDETGKITIELTAPNGSFTNVLGIQFAALVPGDTPAKDITTDPAPATGPYMIVNPKRGQGWSYARNPQWEKTNAELMPDLPTGNFDKIDIAVVRNDSTQVNEIEQDETNWMVNPPPADLYTSVKDEFEGTQFRVERPLNLYYFWMDVNRAPFDDVKVRQAVNYAIDSAALERIYAGQLGGTHQILPEGMPGYKEFDLYPHNMAKAKQLLEEANPSDMEITVWTNNESPNDEAGAYYHSVLKELGFDATLKTVNADVYVPTIGNVSTPDLDTGWINWFADYPNPNGFFEPLLNGEGIVPTNNINFARIDVPKLNEKINELAEEPLGPDQEAEYATLDREFMELAPWAPYGTNTVSTFVDSSINLDEVIFNPTFGHDLTSFELK